MTQIIYDVQWARSEDQAKAMQAAGWKLAPQIIGSHHNNYSLLLERGRDCACCGERWQRQVDGLWRPTCDCPEAAVAA